MNTSIKEKTASEILETAAKAKKAYFVKLSYITLRNFITHENAQSS